MTEHPILFTTPMVRAILEGRKTQTRRVIRQKIYTHSSGYKLMQRIGYVNLALMSKQIIKSPFGWPGDVLWVRETWRVCSLVDYQAFDIEYKADGTTRRIRDDFEPSGRPAGEWYPSIFMPRRFCRLLLRVVEVRVQRVQEISADDGQAEGIDISAIPGLGSDACIVKAFAGLWDSINARRGHPWSANDWVWAITFERIKP